MHNETVIAVLFLAPSPNKVFKVSVWEHKEWKTKQKYAEIFLHVFARSQSENELIA